MIKVNKISLDFGEFPNAETLVKTGFLDRVATDEQGYISIEFRFKDDKSLMRLYFILNHLRQFYPKFKLYIYYMPYSRMDRSQNGSCFTLKYVSEMLNTVLCLEDKVYIMEPHSDVTLQLLNNSERINVITPLMKHILKLNPEIDMICYPDKGAKARFQDDNVELPVVFCNKVRDFDTGEIVGLELDGDTNVDGKNILILDDLCSKGGTFYHTSNKLKQNGAKDVYLGVCHMEATVKYGDIYAEHKNWDEEKVSSIKHIYCLNTMVNDIEAYWLQNHSTNLTMYDTEVFLSKNKFKEVE